jgi:hypothetical protein
VEVRRFCFEGVLVLLCSPLVLLTVSNVWNMAAVERLLIPQAFVSDHSGRKGTLE